MSKSIFLSAEWRHLCLINYEVDPAILAPHIPYGTELDYLNGKTYVSLVAFMFYKTKAFGFLPALFHDTFEEINLRFYVTRGEGSEIKRGVVFIKEIVPKPILAWLARRFYKENYVSMPTKSIIDHKKCYEYHWGPNRLAIQSSGKILRPNEASFERWITEHYWGYTKLPNGSTYEYEVKHPVWDLYEVESHELRADIQGLYGNEFSATLSANAASVFLAEGSDVTVHFPTLIR